MSILSIRYIAFAAAFAIIMAISYYKGYAHEKRKFDAFVEQTKSIAAAQQTINDNIARQHQQDKEDIHNDYQKRLADLRSQYASRVQRSTSGGQMSASTNTPGRTDATAAYDELAAQCAETTLQLTELQDWVRRTSR